MSTNAANFANACRKAIKKGAAFLDNHFGGPDWDEKINLAILEMGSCSRCVCGQLDVSHIMVEDSTLPNKKFMSTTTLDLSGEHGFYSGRIQGKNGNYFINTMRWSEADDKLKKYWVEHIQKRQKARQELK